MSTHRALTNFFATATKGSRVKALRSGDDHSNKLDLRASTDPEAETMRIVFQPFFQEGKSKHIALKVARSTTAVLTREVEGLMDQLATSKPNFWRFELRKLYPLDAPITLELFPLGNAPFAIGTRQSRLDALEELRIKSMAHPELNAISVDIDDFNTLINSRCHAQKIKLEGLKSQSEELDQAIDNLNYALFGDYGLLVYRYRRDPSQIANYFDFDLLQAKAAEEEDYSEKVLAGQTVNVMTKDFTSRSELLIINSGNADLNFCLAPNETTSCQDCGIILHKDERRVLLASELGSIANKYLNVTNLFTEAEGEYSVSIII